MSVLNDSKHAASLPSSLLFLRHRRRRRPLALESTHQMVRCDNAAAWNAWCEGGVVQRTTHGAKLEVYPQVLMPSLAIQSKCAIIHR